MRPILSELRGVVALVSQDLLAMVDTFMAETKTIVGADGPYNWRPGYSAHERATDFPLQVEGEQRGAKLLIVGFPRAKELKFRLSICFNAAICRLDYTDEYHPNSLHAPAGLPPFVQGPHYHSWPLNRQFFRGTLTPPDLHLAEPFTNPARTFDAILRWFCADTKIVGLPPDHLIELPKSDLLI